PAALARRKGETNRPPGARCSAWHGGCSSPGQSMRGTMSQQSVAVRTNGSAQSEPALRSLRHRRGPAAGSATRGDEGARADALARGDAAAFEQAYQRFGGVACGLAYRILGNRAEAQEVVQEVFWQLWRRAGEYDRARGSLVAWLFTMTRNRALDLLRTHKC